MYLCALGAFNCEQLFPAGLAVGLLVLRVERLLSDDLAAIGAVEAILVPLPSIPTELHRA